MIPGKAMLTAFNLDTWIVIFATVMILSFLLRLFSKYFLSDAKNSYTFGAKVDSFFFIYFVFIQYKF